MTHDRGDSQITSQLHGITKEQRRSCVCLPNVIARYDRNWQRRRRLSTQLSKDVPCAFYFFLDSLQAVAYRGQIWRQKWWRISFLVVSSSGQSLEKVDKILTGKIPLSVQKSHGMKDGGWFLLNMKCSLMRCFCEKILISWLIKISWLSWSIFFLL